MTTEIQPGVRTVTGTGTAVDDVAEDRRPGVHRRDHRPAGARRWLRRWWMGIPPLVLAVTGLHVALLVMCTVLYPAFTGPDESRHVDMAYAYSKGHGLYPPAGRQLARGIEVVHARLKVPPVTSYSETPVVPRGERLSIDAAGGDAPPQQRLPPNWMVQHPPLYYLVEAGVLRLPGVDGLPYDRQIALLRWVSVLMVAPLPLLAWATARRLVGDGPVALTAAVLPVTLPGLSRMGAMVNNDSLLILLVSALMLALARVLSGDLRIRTAILVGLLLGLALLTKGQALVLPVPVAAAYLVAWLRHRRSALLPLATAAVVGGAVGGWWWIRNVVLFGAVQPAGAGDEWVRILNGPANPGGTWLDLVPKFVSRFSSRFWGGIGLLENPTLPRWLTAAWLVALLAGVVVAVVVGIGGRWGRAAAAVLALPALLMTGLIFYGSGGQYVYNMRLPGIQGRYVYPALTALAVLAALTAVRLAGRYARVVPLVVLAAGVATHAWAWWLLLRDWWAPTPTQGDLVEMARGAFAGVLRWSPWPNATSLAPFVAVAVLSVAALVVAALAGRRPTGTPAAPPA
jgi:4-amino-4-deoxy-L-arabinose transferase-like glycosyltransferase